MKPVLFTFFALASLILSGCAETQLGAHYAKKMTGQGDPVSEGTFKVGNPYKIQGKTYRPTETYRFTETGIASWYGPGFHGKRTANGEVFDRNELTAAHRTLQMPSLVRVTNLENGRSIIVRVNDRGPFSKGRVMDLSQRGAELLGFKNRGTAKVKLELLEDESRKIANMARRGHDTRGYEVALNRHQGYGVHASPQSHQPPVQAAYQTASTNVPPDASAPIPGHVSADGRFMPNEVVTQHPVSPTSIYVQAGSFSKESNAQALARKLDPIGPSRITLAQVNNQPFYRVRLGPYATPSQADAALRSVLSGGTGDAKIIVD